MINNSKIATDIRLMYYMHLCSSIGEDEDAIFRYLMLEKRCLECGTLGASRDIRTLLLERILRDK